MDKIKELFHTKTPKEIMQENKRAIRRARRELEREKNRLTNEKTRSENEIRKLAAKGEQVRIGLFLFTGEPSMMLSESVTRLRQKHREPTESNQQVRRDGRHPVHARIRSIDHECTNDHGQRDGQDNQNLG